MNTGVQTAVIPLYIKECNFFYLFYLTFGKHSHAYLYYEKFQRI